MNFYTFDYYGINKGVSIENDYIIDKRLNRIIKFSPRLKRDIVLKIFKCKNVKVLLQNDLEDCNEIKNHLEILYELDILNLYRPCVNKVIMSHNFISLILKALFWYIIRFLPIILICLFLLALSEEIHTEITYILGIYFLLSIAHEFGHLLSYYLCNEKKLECYFRINNFNLQLVTHNLKKKFKIIIAINGPGFAILIGSLLIYFTNNTLISLFLLPHVAMLLPIFDDGKQIWCKDQKVSS